MQLHRGRGEVCCPHFSAQFRVPPHNRIFGIFSAYFYFFEEKSPAHVFKFFFAHRNLPHPTPTSTTQMPQGRRKRSDRIPTMNKAGSGPPQHPWPTLLSVFFIHVYNAMCLGTDFSYIVGYFFFCLVWSDESRSPILPPRFQFRDQFWDGPEEERGAGSPPTFLPIDKETHLSWSPITIIEI